MNNGRNSNVEEISQLAELAENLAAAAINNGLIIFAGAGISVLPPSSCPTWIGLRKAVLAAFLDKLIAEDWPKKQYLRDSKQDIQDINLRPETFMWSLVSNIGLQKVTDILGGINTGSPNCNHEAIAGMVKAGFIRGIITTNFDTYIEQAIESRQRKYQVVRDEKESGSLFFGRWGRVLVFKPHGCLSQPSSMEYRIDQIQSLPKNKRKLLFELLGSAPVLVIGYSGNDEDIFPIMQSALAASRFESFLCIYPGSPENEPIQQWDIRELPKIRRFYAQSDVLLHALGEWLNLREMRSPDFSSDTTSLWKENIDKHVKEIPHDIIAITIAQLALLHGNYRRTISFANLAQDICEDTNLSRTPQKSLMVINEIQSRAYKELSGLKDLAVSMEGARLTHVLESGGEEEKIGAILDHAYMALRTNDIGRAEHDLSFVAPYFADYKISKLDDVSENIIAYLWYSGILKSKQSLPQKAEEFFYPAITITQVQNDIIKRSMILLDYGYVKCQMNDWESAQQIWQQAASLAEQANVWDTAAKAAENRGILLSASDQAHLGRLELERSSRLFLKAGNFEGLERIKGILQYSEQDFIQAMINLNGHGPLESK